ncbi:hypothetical protein JQS43_05985 [Natronosporangium hydrolyticum]|uniref:GH26 domain-containing protein n=1 Tax=Natronosporangium hydrolyticum TaxID=2811111 RepID=A0A895YP42_9ACTN|nr:hypothetical protein [Natronosporangium hydrolyticum]QSB15880.1 hypothetical protein JQS43_05985 [Natronosporangium hydrolyticum]
MPTHARRRRRPAPVRVLAVAAVFALLLAGVPLVHWWDRLAPPEQLAVSASWTTYLVDGSEGPDRSSEPYLLTGSAPEGTATGYLAFEVPPPVASEPLRAVTLRVRLSHRATSLALFAVPQPPLSAAELARTGPPAMGPLLAVARPVPGTIYDDVAFDLTGVVRESGRYAFALRSPPMDGDGRIVAIRDSQASPRLTLDWGGDGDSSPEAAAAQRQAMRPAPLIHRALGTAPPALPAGAPTPEAPAGSPGAPSVPPSGRIEVGSTVQVNGGGWPGAYQRADEAYGPVEMFRVFHPGLPPDWPGSAADHAGRTVNVSFKADPEEVLAGEHDAALARWFASLPTDRDIYWTYHHEPENNIEAGDFTADQYRAAWRRVAWLADQVEHPSRYATLVLMGWSLEPASGRNWRDYYPGADVISVLGWDIYNFDYQQGGYSAPPVLFDRAIAVSRTEGKPWGISEYGGRRVDGDEAGHRRAEWIRETTDYLATHPYPPVWVAWYDALIGDGEDYRLIDEPSRAAWAEFARGQG